MDINSDFILANINYFFNLIIIIVFLAALMLFYRHSGHRGYLLLIIGDLFSLGWKLLYLFGLGGVFFVNSLQDQGFSQSTIGIVIFVLSLATFFISLFRIFLFIIGLALISGDLTKVKKNRQVISQPFIN